jgi:hypothetical protein
MKDDPMRTVQAGCLVEAKLPLMAESLDAFAGNSVISTYAPLLRPDRPWRSQLFEDWHIVSVSAWRVALALLLRCVLSREGQVNIYGPGGKPDHTFQIPEAGVFTDTAIGLGYVNRIRAVGSTLYVCGQSRQVWRFDWNGLDLGKGRWLDAAGPMRQRPMDEPPDDDEALDAWLDANDAVDLVDIGGTSEHDLYVTGDETWHHGAAGWRQLALPTDEPVAAIKVIGSTEVWLAGHNGTLLQGNAATGFVERSSADDNQNFTGIEYFGGLFYLASNLGLFTYDPATRRIEPCSTGLQPELQDTHQLEAKDGVLWSFGFKDLAFFDGKTWTRVDHPDNPPIR